MHRIEGFGLVVVCAALPMHASPGEWPQWRGPNRDAHVAADEHFPKVLPSAPKPVWQLNIGGGFSSPVIDKGKLAYLDTSGGREVAHLIDASSGKELWKIDYADDYGDEWGTGPRSTPIIDGDHLYVQS